MMRFGMHGSVACFPSDCVIVTGVQAPGWPDGSGITDGAGTVDGVILVVAGTIPGLFFSVPVHPADTARASSSTIRIMADACFWIFM
jgi:hypothetical protein